MCDDGDFFSASQFVILRAAPMLLPHVAIDFHLNLMAGSIEVVKITFADKLLSWHFTIGIVDISELIERNLTATVGCNLPVSDSELVVAKIIVV